MNIIPVIAKSDTLTVEEREAFKQRVCVEYLGQAHCQNLCANTPFRSVKTFGTMGSTYTQLLMRLTRMRRLQSPISWYSGVCVCVCCVCALVITCDCDLAEPDSLHCDWE